MFIVDSESLSIVYIYNNLYRTSLIDDTEIMSLEDLGKFLRSITELRGAYSI